MEGSEAVQATETAAVDDSAAIDTLGGGEQQAAGGGEQQQSALPEGAPEWSAPLFEQMGQLAESVQQTSQEEEQQYQGGFTDQMLADPDEVDDDPDEGGEQQQTDPDLEGINVELFNRLVDQRVQEQIGPLAGSVQQTFKAQAASALEQKYPDLAKPEVAGPVVQGAREYAARAGQPELADQIWFVEMFYEAAQARQRAAGEKPAAQQQNPPLETEAASQGAQAPAGQQGKEEANAILNAGGGGAFSW